MEQNYELIKEVYQNAEMSKDIIGRLIKICDDSNFRAALAIQFAEYHEVVAQAKSYMEVRGYPVRTNKAGKAASMAGIRLNTLIDKTSSHLAEMMVQGSIMGVIDMKRALKDYISADDETRALAQKLYRTEYNNVNCMLDYV